jgi:D-alanyl-D-alanine carboxypeptidase
LAERIFEPLGMSHSRAISVLDVIPNRASGYTVLPKTIQNSELIRMSAAWSAGCILSTATDMAKWDVALMNRKVLKPEDYALYWSPVTLNSGRTYPYGFGWMIHQAFGDNVIEHGGNTFGQSAGNWFFMSKGVTKPSEKGTITVIALANKYGANFGGLPNLIAGLYDPSVVGPTKSATTDPDPELTKKLRDGMNSFLNGQLRPEFHSSEMIESYKTMRHRANIGALKSAFGRVLAMKYVDSQQLPKSKLIRYSLTTEKLNHKIGMMLEVAPEGKIVRVEQSNLR